MKCFGQIVHETGNMSCPMPDQYIQWDSITEAKDSLAREHNDPMGNDEEGVTLLLWMGEPDPEEMFPCDMSHNYPDRVYVLGPRGGVRYTG